MASYRSVGEIPPKRHTAFRQPDGSLYAEELMGEEGFSSDSSLLYHQGIPSATSGARAWTLPDLSTTPNHPLRPVHLRLPELFTGDSSEIDHVSGRRLVLGNGDVRISYAVGAKASPLYRNATGDECVYIEDGRGFVDTVFGTVPFRGPRLRDHPAGHRAPLAAVRGGEGVLHRGQLPHRAAETLPVEVRPVPRAQSVLRARSASTDGPLLDEGADVEIYTKHRGSGPSGIVGSIVTASTHPFDVVGWDGCLYPYTFNVDDFEPITGRVHQPPPVHQVFEGGHFVICNFVPRKVDYHPLAIPVPYYHSNVDSDEVMFYCGGDYEARKGSGIGLGSITLHPGGHSHGPQPGAAEAAIGKDYFDELAVMVDTFRPLEFGEGGVESDDRAYALSWHRALQADR